MMQPVEDSFYTHTKIEQLLKDDGYKDWNKYTLLITPTSFSELWKDKDINIVQVHSISLAGFTEGCYKNKIVGFCGAFSWKDNTVSSLDGDSYNPGMKVYGYKWFTDNTDEAKGLNVLNIIVGDDW